MVKSEATLSGVMAREREKILACVHCGLCLEACPTYLATGNENDSPRGRIYLMRAVGEGKLPLNSNAFENHINRCLGCRACEPVCPAGVEYGNLLESARAELKSQKKPRGFVNLALSAMLRYVWLYPRRLRFMFFCARMLRGLKVPALLSQSSLFARLLPRAAFGLALLEASSPVSLNVATTQDTTKKKTAGARKSVMLFTGCVTDGLFRRVNEATQRVLQANQRETQTPPQQGCCGALHAHSGDLNGAKILAKRNLEAFAGSDAPIVTNAGGCGAMLCNYGHLLADDAEYAERAKAFSARIRDISQELPHEPLPAISGDGDAVTYDASCHLLHGQKAGDDALRMLLAAGVNYAPLTGSDVCCGGAGIYNLLEPELSAQILREKLAHIQRAGAKILATGNPGCHLQIRAGMKLLNQSDLRVCHPVEILDESYRCAGRYPKP